MSEKKLKWNEGDGYITTVAGGSGDMAVPFSSVANDGIDRERIVHVITRKNIVRSVTVRQPGLREILVGRGDDTFLCADGGTFNVLKDGVQQ